MNENVSKYKVIKNFENYTRIMQKLEEQNIVINYASELKLDALKLLLTEFEESMIESFFNDLQSFKESQNSELANGFHLKEFDDFHEICKILIESGLNFEDTINLDDENLRNLLADFHDQNQISLFVPLLEKIKFSKNSLFLNQR